MKTEKIKAQIRKRANQIEDDVAAAAATRGNGAETFEGKSDELQEKLREMGRDLLESTRKLTEEATRQARMRPLAVFGIAFVAGVVVARMLRR